MSSDQQNVIPSEVEGSLPAQAGNQVPDPGSAAGMTGGAMQKIQDILLKLPEMLKNMVPKKKQVTSVEPPVQAQVQPQQVPELHTTYDVQHPEAQTQQTQPTPQPAPPLPANMPKKSNKGMIIGVIVVVVFLLIMVVGMVMFGGLPNPAEVLQPEVSPTPTPTPVEITEQKSPYADDPEVIEIIDELSTYEGKLNSTNLREDTLRVPNVDWEINFK